MQRMLWLTALLCVESFIDIDAHERRFIHVAKQQCMECWAQFMVEVVNYKEEIFMLIDE